MMPPKAADDDFFGRFREIISDPLNLLIKREHMAGILRDGDVCLHNGNWVPLSGEGAYYGDFSRILMLNRGVHEPLEEYVFQETMKHLPPAPMMLELGAYWGHYSMWLKKIHPQSQVVLVEPDKAGLQAGRSNFVRNGYEGEFINAKVAKGEFEVDTFLRERGIKQLDILHSDIQGFEMEMLGGACDALSQARIDCLFVSTHSQQLHSDVIDLLKSKGYRIEVSSDFEHETTSFDGFVFATSPRVSPMLEGFRPMGREQIVGSNPKEMVVYLTSCAGPI